MSERYCIRGCVRRDVHFATCTHHGPEYLGQFPCRGCAPRECRDGSLICDRCFGRMRALLADVPDLLGRLHSIADPMKATPTDQLRVASSSTEPPAPVGADLLDAITDVEPIRAWSHVDLTQYTNDGSVIGWLASAVLDRHSEVDGIRTAWSVQDAVDKWGLERRTTTEPEWEDDDVSEEVRTVSEWDDRLLTRAEAGAAAGSMRTLRRWEKDDKIAPEGRMVIAGVVTTWYRYSEIVRVRNAMQAKAASTQFKSTDAGERADHGQSPRHS